MLDYKIHYARYNLIVLTSRDAHDVEGCCINTEKQSDIQCELADE